MRSVRVAVLVALTAALLPTSGPASAAPPQAAGARAVPWRTTTTITWSGTRGMRLSSVAPLDFSFSGGRDKPGRFPYELRLLKGTYAFVRIVAPTGSPCSDGTVAGPRCSVWSFSYAKALPKDFRDGFAWTPLPSETMTPGTTDVYLFTDGMARLDLRPHGAAPGTAQYRPVGKITGTVQSVRNDCAAACGADDFGGATRPVRAGAADVFMINMIRGYEGPLCRGEVCTPLPMTWGTCAESMPRDAPPLRCPTGGGYGEYPAWVAAAAFTRCAGYCYLGWSKTGAGKPVAFGTWYEEAIR